MSDRITNAELKEVHSYLDEMDNERFCILMHKLLATFNFLVINGREWKRKTEKTTMLEVELVEKKQEIIRLNRRIERKQDKIEDLIKQLQEENENGERYFNAYKQAVNTNERLKMNIKILERKLNEANIRSIAQNKEK